MTTQRSGIATTLNDSSIPILQKGPMHEKLDPKEVAQRVIEKLMELDVDGGADDDDKISVLMCAEVLKGALTEKVASEYMNAVSREYTLLIEEHRRLLDASAVFSVRVDGDPTIASNDVKVILGGVFANGDELHVTLTPEGVTADVVRGENVVATASYGYDFLTPAGYWDQEG